MLLPNEIAVVCVNGRQKGNTLEARGNRLADETAKEAALSTEPKEIYVLVPSVPDPKEVPIFTK